MDTNIEFAFIGWCYDTANHHDKVWTAFKRGNKYYSGWGRRDKKLAFKLINTGWAGEAAMRTAIAKKTAPKGNYTEVDAFKLFSIFPTFEQDVAANLDADIAAKRIW